MTKFKKHLIIVGSARSGTSWLAEIIATQYRYRLLFEPEHEFQTEKGHLICDKYILPNTTSKNVEKYLNRVFANKIDNDWIGQCSNRTLKRHLWPFLPKKYIIKFVRANLSAHFMNNRFNIPVIFLIRNPYDVIHSQLRSKFPWLLDLSHFVDQPKLVSLIKKTFDYDISNYKTLKEHQILCLRWCIENVIPIEVHNDHPKNVAVIRYEKLKNDIQQFYNICQKFDLQPRKDIVSIYRKPSSKTHPKSNIITKKDINVKWTTKDKKEINFILNTFETKLYPIIQ